MSPVDEHKVESLSSHQRNTIPDALQNGDQGFGDRVRPEKISRQPECRRMSPASLGHCATSEHLDPGQRTCARETWGLRSVHWLPEHSGAKVQLGVISITLAGDLLLKDDCGSPKAFL